MWESWKSWQTFAYAFKAGKLTSVSVPQWKEICLAEQLIRDDNILTFLLSVDAAFLHGSTRILGVGCLRSRNIPQLYRWGFFVSG